MLSLPLPTYKGITFIRARRVNPFHLGYPTPRTTVITLRPNRNDLKVINYIGSYKTPHSSRVTKSLQRYPPLSLVPICLHQIYYVFGSIESHMFQVVEIATPL